MPAVLSALCSAIFAYFATKEAYGDSLFSIFPGMKNSTLLGEADEHETIIGVSRQPTRARLSADAESSPKYLIFSLSLALFC